MTPTPNTHRPAGASDHPGWKIVWAYATAVSSRTANRSPENIVAEQKAVWVVNELLERMERQLPPSPHVEYSASRGQSKVEYWVSREEGDRIWRAAMLSGSATPPSSDGGEGAVSNVLDALGWLLDAIKMDVDKPTPLLKARFAAAEKALLHAAAPPKPAPDAAEPLLNSLDEIVRYLRKNDPAVYNLDDYTELLQAGLKQLRVRLSAPVPSPDPGLDKFKRDVAAYYVPSPDGARALIRRCAMVAEGFGAACNSPMMEKFVEAGLVQEVYKRDAAIAKAILALSPTGAAEPDDDWEARSERSYIDNAAAELDAVREAVNAYDNIIGLCQQYDKYSSFYLTEQIIAKARIGIAAISICAPAVHGEQHIARFLARLIYRRGVAYGPGLESADAWVDANWQSFREDARRLGGMFIRLPHTNAETY